MSPPRIALVTCKHRKEPDPDEDLLLAAVRGAGLECEWIAWDDEDRAPEAFDLCVLRTTWNFYERIDAFRAWIERAARGSRLLNPAPLVHANLHKGYLDGLAKDAGELRDAVSRPVGSRSSRRAGARGAGRSRSTRRRSGGWS